MNTHCHNGLKVSLINEYMNIYLIDVQEKYYICQN